MNNQGGTGIIPSPAPSSHAWLWREPGSPAGHQGQFLRK